jgi:long-subunit acyl-CoA synthetase (AMP-forming)
LSETGALSSGIELMKNSYYIGKLLQNIQAKVVDQNRQNLNPYEKGELSFRTPFPFLGYWGEPDKTKKMVDFFDWKNQ